MKTLIKATLIALSLASSISITAPVKALTINNEESLEIVRSNSDNYVVKSMLEPKTKVNRCALAIMINASMYFHNEDDQFPNLDSAARWFLDKHCKGMEEIAETLIIKQIKEDRNDSKISQTFIAKEFKAYLDILVSAQQKMNED